MSLETLPEKVRQSILTQVLDSKLSSPQCVEFDYWGEFKRLRDLVSAQVGEIKSVFPQFTPHDEEHHLSRIFGIADKMLGQERYERMNAAELFLLACGLYAHDWGMAVGQEEFEHLRHGGAGSFDSEIFTPLDDECLRLREFAERQGLRATNPDEYPELDDNYLRAYVRYTHAWRSGVRVRTFFKAAGCSLPQAMERVCRGHWLDFPELDDESRYPIHFGVLGQTVNLRAIALYVRLVDLFDIADDRTPYAIWRFVAPQDPRAKIEWSKHRALSPVTFPAYGDGRSARFDGSTSDPEVWAELEDLHTYCKTQLFGAIDLLARHHDERHQLDLRKIEWAVTAERFTPVNIRFEFQRQRMFEILADEIYQGDSHVFLRELLQNSIDAIRMRREMVKRRAERSGSRRDLGLGFDDAIYFSVEHGADGDALVHCRDYGIGMDEYVIRNYLAVAGASYYQSDEFRHLCFSMDPISRFGIGILSCFMVADRIEIETFREPHLSADGKPLRIEIPSPNHQFRIFAAPASTNIGTVVTVHVCGAKLKTDVRRKEAEIESDVELPATPRLQVTEYLAAIAGFVEFPIVIDEDGQRTVILHPERQESDAREFFRDGEEMRVRQLSHDYPWDEVFVPQDADNAARILQPQVFDMRRDLGLEAYEGSVSYLMPLDDGCVYLNAYGDHNSLRIGVNKSEPSEFYLFRFTNDWICDFSPKSGIAPSCKRTPEFAIYRDGILVADATLPRRDYLNSIQLAVPDPILKINLPVHIAGPTDVARRTFINSQSRWDLPIWRGVLNYLRENEFEKAHLLEPSARIMRLTKLALHYCMTYEELITLVPLDSMPLPVLSSDGKGLVSEVPLTKSNTILKVPTDIARAVYVQLGWSTSKSESSLLSIITRWKGEAAIVFNSEPGNELCALWMAFIEWLLGVITTPTGVRFLKAPLQGLAPIPQHEYIIVEQRNIDKMTLLEAAIVDPLRLNAEQRCSLRQSSVMDYKLKVIADAVPFAAPFENCFAWGDRYLNLNHPTTCALFRCVAALQLHKRKKTMPAMILGKVEDTLNIINNNLGSPTILGEKLTEFWALVKEYGLIELHETPPSPTASDYVWGSLDLSREKFFYSLTMLTPTLEKYLRPFGQVLTDDTQEELPPDLAIALDPIKTAKEAIRLLGLPEYGPEGP